MYKGLTCGRLVFVSNRSGAGKPFQTVPGRQLCILGGWYVLGHRYIPRKDACFSPLHTISAHEAAMKTIGPRNFQNIHLLCKHSLSLAQYIMREKEDGNERRSLKIKFQFSLQVLGVFYRSPGLLWKPIYKVFEFKRRWRWRWPAKYCIAPSKSPFFPALFPHQSQAFWSGRQTAVKFWNHGNVFGCYS